MNYTRCSIMLALVMAVTLFWGSPGAFCAEAPAQQQTDLQTNGPAAAYDNAVKELQNGNYDRAIDLFISFSERFPKYPRLEEVQWGLAEAYYGKGDFKHSLAEYSRFYQDFTDSPRMAEALFKIAKCYEGLADYETALLSLKVVTKKFKNSPFAERAKATTTEIKKKMNDSRK
jgi:TolA-binding protein